MANPEKTKKPVAAGVKRKNWYKILAPKTFNEEFLGETAALEANMLIGRTVQTNLGRLIRDMKKQSINVTFEVNDIKGDNALTRLKRYEVAPASIKRMVRRGKNRIDYSFGCVTSDGKYVTIKPFILTMNLTKNSIKTRIRKLAEENLVKTISKMNYDNLVHEIVSTKLQKNVRSILSKIYPLRIFEIRVMSLGKKEKRIEGVEEEKKIEAPEKKEAPKKAEEAEEEKAVKEEKPKPKESKKEKKSAKKEKEE